MAAHLVVEASPATLAEVATRTPGLDPVVVATTDDAAAALLGALAGNRLLVDLRLTGSERVRFVEDLHRVGEVDHRMGPTPLDSLDADQRALLRELATGASLGEAAERLHLSRRTADRRVAGAREVLGARSTVVAVSVYSALSRG